MSDSGQFVSLNSSTAYSNSGYTISNNGSFYYALPSGQPFTYATYGGAVTQCNLGVIANNYYSLTYVFNGDSSYYINPDYSSFSYKVGANTSFLNSQPSFSATQNSIAQATYVPNLNSPFGDTLHTFTTVFKAPRTANCLSLAFSSSTRNVTTSEAVFVGYKFESLGNEPLTSEQITNILNTSNQTVINSINANSNANRQAIIDNQNANNQALIDANQQNTQDIIDNNNENFNNCTTYDYNRDNITLYDGYLNPNGQEAGVSTPTYKHTDYIKVNKDKIYHLSMSSQSEYFSYCLYNSNKDLISCTSYTNGTSIDITPSTDGFIRYTVITFWQVNFTGEYCINRIDQTNQSINDLNDTINNDDVSEADPLINDFLNDSAFQDNTGLSSVINAPLSLLSHLTESCQPINFTIPWFEAQVSIPCMSTSVYNKFDSSFITIIKAIINGVLVYRIVIGLYFMVKDFKDPESDRVEVVDL